MNTNVKIPPIGLGTWRLNGEECVRTVKQALEIGYRHIDTADAYENHREIAKGITGFPRNELFIATKLYTNNLLPENVRASVPRFLDELQTDYIDLLLIHWPNPDVNLIDTLLEMLVFKEKGIVKAVGVSNFVKSHLEDIARFKLPILTNQIELHPDLQRRSLVEECKKLGIGITAYRPLAKGAFEKDPVLQKIGAAYGKSPSQVVLRWLYQKDIPSIPKASSIKHLQDNLQIFDFSLNNEDMEKINHLDSGKRYCAPEGLPVYEDEQ